MIYVKAGDLLHLTLEIDVQTSFPLKIDDNDIESLKAQVKAYLLTCKDIPVDPCYGCL